MNLDLDTGVAYDQKRLSYYPNLREQIDLLWHAVDEGKFGEDAKLRLFILS